MLKCPRDATELRTESYRGIEVFQCPECNGRWLENDELGELEATVADEEERLGTIEYAQTESELLCIVCSRRMVAFNYRAYNLQLDTCEELHGYWLDAGEENRVRDILKERVHGLQRAASAEESWRRFLQSMRTPSTWDNIRGLFGRRP
jgi:Zn-finger nucleic acid-binding protein